MNKTSYRKSTMFTDPLSSPSLVGSSSFAANGSQTTRVVHPSAPAVTDNSGGDDVAFTQRSAPPTHIYVTSSSPLSSQPVHQASADVQQTEGPILSALRQGDSDLYKMSFDELRQLVGEVIREPGFPELSISVGPNYFAEQALFTPAINTGFMANNFPHGPQTAFLLNTPGPNQSSFLAQQQQPPQPPPPQNRQGMHRAHASMALMTPASTTRRIGSSTVCPEVEANDEYRWPPKAVLGGPNRKTSPLPPMTPAGENAPGLPDVKKKKMTVKLPLESEEDKVDGAESGGRTKSLWSRSPVPASELPPEVLIDSGLEATTVEPHPDHVTRGDLPNSIGVFLPGKHAWDVMRQEIIEEKLAKLGVERGSGASYLPSQPHGRAFSISTPADPSLLFSKLNKLQASQSPSLASSPGPNSPFFHAPRLPHQHGYTQSLAVQSQPQFGLSPQLGGGLDLTTQRSPTNLSTSISVTSDSESSAPIIHAPQGVVPIRATALSRPDFVRGFGLDVTEEEDEGQEEDEADEDTQTASEAEQPEPKRLSSNSLTRELTQAFGQPFKPAPTNPEPEAEEEDADDEGDDSMTAAAHSRHHSRHLSHASLRSLGRRTMSEEPPVNRIPREDDLPEGESEYEEHQARSAVETWDGAQSENGQYGQDAAAEWTGSDTESTGEWSNPSDEDRARQERRIRKLARAQVGLPRRIPEFPHPPHVESESYGPSRMERAESEDIVSNPSEEGYHPQTIHSQLVEQHQSGSLSPRPFRPLPPVPQSASHSRQTSANLVFAMPKPGSAELRHVEDRPSHSRGPSFNVARESLNPLAKPFVFGSIRGSSTSSIPVSQPVRGSIGSPSEFGPIAPPAGAHSRQASIGTKLNAGAMEFKPSGNMFGNASFTFKLPPGVPTLSFGSGDSTSSRPQPELPHQSPARATQGREKRQRRISDGLGLENTELDSPVETIQKDTPGRDNITTWRYPTIVSPVAERIIPKATLNPAAKPFSFNGSASSFVPRTSSTELPPPAVSAPVEKTPLTIFAPQTKRNTLPEFAQPNHANTVPASVFKSLAQHDGPTRPTVRSRLSSREAFDGHSNRPSLDDINVPSISLSRKARNVTPPKPTIDVFGPVEMSAQKPLSKSPIPGFLKLGVPPRRASPSPAKRLFTAPPDPTIGTSVNDLRGVVEQALDVRMDALREAINSSRSQSVELGRRESESIGGPSELDLELIRSTIESGQLNTHSMLQRELAAVMERMDLISAQNPLSADVSRLAEESRLHIASSVADPLSQLASQLGALEQAVHRQDQRLVDQLVSTLVPHLEAARAAPIDTDALTVQLTQAVKPHISQLIDLASDKRETAMLIVQHLAPALNNIQPPRIDISSLATQTAQALRSSIPPPTDPHVLKEHVADLVVERLDSRLAVRDSSYNAETISQKIMEALAPALRPVELTVATTKLDELSQQQQDVLAKTLEIVQSQQSQSAELAALPGTLQAALESLKAAQTEFTTKLGSIGQLDDVQKLTTANVELQSELGSARAAHERAQNERDSLDQRLQAAERELASLRAAAAERDALTVARDTELSVLKAKEGTMQSTLTEALAKADKAEALLRVNQERILTLEKVNNEKTQENYELQMRVNTLELEATYASRDLESSKKLVSQLEGQRNNLMAQQKHWDDLRRTADRVESLVQQMEREDSEEVAELKRARDESKILAGEHTYLKKRFEEQERRIADFTRGQQTAKQTIAQAQQQVADWERRATIAETELETQRARVDELEETRSQVQEQVAQLQLRVKDLLEAEQQHDQRAQSMQNQIVTLEHQLDTAKAELAEANRPQTPVAPVPQRNGVVTGLPMDLSRSLSRLSHSTSVYTPTRQGLGGSLHAPNGLTNGKTLDLPNGSASPPPPSVWASMHAPTNGNNRPLVPPQTPRPSHARQAQHHRPRVPSPAQSIASTTLTCDEEGWYS
ncbi:hypothetical protein RhiJN_04820 [Ceratobasidium sp. AG-Ba]|nr:hypothetical protein RhiJN_04820 [Ceratobasidium sp. AG-Ba]